MKEFNFYKKSQKIKIIKKFPHSYTSKQLFTGDSDNDIDVRAYYAQQFDWFHRYTVL